MEMIIGIIADIISEIIIEMVKGRPIMSFFAALALCVAILAAVYYLG